MKKNYFLFIAIVSALMVNHLQATTYYLKSGGAITNLASWGINTDGTGTAPASFSGVHIWNLHNNASISLSAGWGVATTATVNVGNGVSAITFSLTGTGKIGSVATPFFNLNNNAVFVIDRDFNLTTSKTNMLTGSTCVFTSNSTSGVSDDFYNLSILDDTYLNTNVIVNGVLTVSPGKLLDIEAASVVLTINGSIANSGQIAGGTTSTLIFNGTTSTLNIAPINISGDYGKILASLTVNLSSAANSLILNTDTLTISDELTINNGILNINGNTLVTSTTNAVSLGGGQFGGSATSSLFLGASSISGSLGMDPSNKSLKVFQLNATGSSLALSNDMEILDSIQVAAGSMNFGGFLTLKSTAALKGRLAEVGGTVSGNIKVETFIPGGSAGWANLGPAGVSGLSVSNWDGGSGSSTGFAMTCSGCINDEYSANGTYFVSIESDPSGTGSYVDLTSGDALTPGAGYWVYIGSSLTSAIDITQTNAGPVVTGGVSGSGFMSNPYPSPISVDRLKSHNGGLSSVDVYNANTGAFVTFNGGIPSAATIPMGQGFYANGIASINFLESDKVSNNTISLLKTASQANNASIGDVVQLQIIGSNGEVDDTYIRFHGNATTGFDNDLDGYKRYTTPGYVGYPGPYNKYTTIATVNTNKDYAINSLPYATTIDAVIPVKVKVSTTGNYSILPINIQNFPGNACITLKDKLLNVSHDLRTGAYVCHIEDTTSTARFELTVCANQQSSTVGIKDISATNSLIFINQDKNGAYVKTSFETSTKATISAFNTMGQQLMADKEVEGKDNTTYLDLGNVHSQVVIIRVTTAKESSFKKIYIN